MKTLKVIFMGTPDFSTPSLDILHKNTNVLLVVTSPDAYVGRKRILTPSPVKKYAINNNIPVLNPQNINEIIQNIKELKPDIIITCAYGKILPEEILNIPNLGCINIHASLLPKYRGGAPIHHAILNDEKETGITIMYMDKGMDDGDIIYQKEIDIKEDDTLETLSNKLSLLGAKTIIETLPSIINKTNKRIKQDPNKVTYAPIIKREDEKLNFNLTGREVYNKVRTFLPEPMAYFILDNIEYKVGKCFITNDKGIQNTIIKVEKDSFTIMTKDKGIKITEIKPIGKKLMTVKDFFNGKNKEDFLGKEITYERTN